jgi:hypothetical protein
MSVRIEERVLDQLFSEQILIEIVVVQIHKYKYWYNKIKLALMLLYLMSLEQMLL